MRAAILTFLTLAGPVLAETPMTALQFDSYSNGKTLFYSSQGTAYGAEQYLPGRRVIWSFLDGECLTGEWFEHNDQICFVYDGEANGPQCWSFFARDNGILAQFENDPDATTLVEVNQSPEPLYCPGPQVGV
ncbi:hypothetical protein ACMU_03695 [Actibacterium mucosum KCTC 23349]|uniref:Uncharacterized protein n=2 Tax=Actibacterium TaxID=1433986 RepID=A0A037ZCG6_9RHOB|nr:hypothetical protein ACMU_03695 [Actibacterium mucosum KCTC 23349]